MYSWESTNKGLNGTVENLQTRFKWYYSESNKCLKGTVVNRTKFLKGTVVNRTKFLKGTVVNWTKFLNGNVVNQINVQMVL